MSVDINDLLNKANEPGKLSSASHKFFRGKMETTLKCSIRDVHDFAIWYTPGVAEPCKEIARDPEKVYDYTSKWNTIAVISDGTRVLGLGDIGPKAGLPVMEGKALLFKYLGGVDAIGITLDTKDPDKLIETVLMMQPAFGGINLEDIAQPKCFRILDELRQKAEIPIWHDDQQGTATVTLAGLMNAIKVVGKKKEEVRIVFIGSGAASAACARLAFGWGINPAQAMIVDSRGILNVDRKDLQASRAEYAQKWRLCETTNAERRSGGIADAMRGADVVVALSKPEPGTIQADWIRSMAKDPIVFACANPLPEIWPWDAKEAGAAIVATGRSDFPNQVNNSLCFPGIFRGTLDVRARTITDEMCYAAAETIAGQIEDKLDAEHIIPSMEDEDLYPRQAAAAGMVAQQQGIARVQATYDQLYEQAKTMIARSRNLTRWMMEEGYIPKR